MIATETTATTSLRTPFGVMIAAANNEGIVRLHFDGTPQDAVVHEDDGYSAGVHLALLRHELEEYFAGRLKTFSVAVSPAGSNFETRAWDYLRTIPFGETRTYGAQAKAIGAPDSCRAVGRANGLNDVAIVIPCHRVIGAGGRLTGYAGGLHRKQWLLDHERGVLGGSLFQ